MTCVIRRDSFPFTEHASRRHPSCNYIMCGAYTRADCQASGTRERSWQQYCGFGLCWTCPPCLCSVTKGLAGPVKPWACQACKVSSVRDLAAGWDTPADEQRPRCSMHNRMRLICSGLPAAAVCQQMHVYEHAASWYPAVWGRGRDYHHPDASGSALPTNGSGLRLNVKG